MSSLLVPVTLRQFCQFCHRWSAIIQVCRVWSRVCWRWARRYTDVLQTQLSSLEIKQSSTAGWQRLLWLLSSELQREIRDCHYTTSIQPAEKGHTWPLHLSPSLFLHTLCSISACLPICLLFYVLYFYNTGLCGSVPELSCFHGDCIPLLASSLLPQNTYVYVDVYNLCIYVQFINVCVYMHICWPLYVYVYMWVGSSDFVKNSFYIGILLFLMSSGI